MRRLVLVLAIVCACGGVRGKRWDTTRLVSELGLDGAVEALRVRIADEPGDVGARRALAELEDRRGRPGAVIEQLEIVAAIGGPFGSRLDAGERARLGALYVERAQARAQRLSPDALADLDRGVALGAKLDDVEDLRDQAAWALALAELRDTDPDRRARGVRRLAATDESDYTRVAAALADPEHADDVEGLGEVGLTLWIHGAKRVAHDLLDVWERRGGRADSTPAQIEAWLSARAWWGGAADRPDLATLAQAVEQGGSPCHFALALGDHGCRARDGDVPGLIARARARGWRTSDPDEAAGWVIVTARAWFRGEIRSWLDELDARVDLSVIDAVPRWAQSPLLRAAGRADDAAKVRARVKPASLTEDQRFVHALELALTGDAAGDVKRDAPAAAPSSEPDAPDVDDEVVRAFRVDPASADRVAADVVARAVDGAYAAAKVADQFLLLEDPARARSWYERAVDAAPEDAGYRAGLVRALAASGDGAAARQALVTAAARSGDAGRAMLDGARALAEAGLLVDALDPAKRAVELTAPGEQQEALALAIELATELDRAEQVATLGAALAEQQAPRDPTTLRARALAGDPDALAQAFAADPTDAALALLATDATDDAAALRRAAEWNPTDVALFERLGDADRLALLAAAGDRDAKRAYLAVTSSAAGASSR